jgi:hypothetical protein
MTTNQSLIQTVAATLFALAILHTFCVGYFARLAQGQSAHAGLWHWLSEIEAVFAFWALLLLLAIWIMDGTRAMTLYIDNRNFTEPMFVFAIMVISATRPVLQALQRLLRQLARIMPLPGSCGMLVIVLTLVPLLGSLITEPAAMTLAALLLHQTLFTRGISAALKYATLGVLFVNISIGGTLTPYAAPPVLMVAGTWQWDLPFMLANFGWRAALAVSLNALGLTLLFGKELARLPLQTAQPGEPSQAPVPLLLTLVHLAFLAAVVVFAHHPALFIALLLGFIGISQAYAQHQDRLLIREALLVAVFLAGLVILGGQQQWWLQPLLLGMHSDTVFWGATALTAVTDNAALTYLGSLVEGLSEEFKIALVAGAVTGGGLTIIANAPNPAGAAILRQHFEQQTVQPLALLLAATPPTAIAALAFRLL